MPQALLRPHTPLFSQVAGEQVCNFVISAGFYCIERCAALYCASTAGRLIFGSAFV